MTEPLVTLYQAEWCPFSSAVRELLTELGIDAVLRQVEPWPEDRESLREVAGVDQIPVMVSEDGRVFRGTREIFVHLETRVPGRFAADHRQRYLDHRDARESDAAGQLLAHFHGDGDLEPADAPDATPADARVVDVPDASRYELLLGDRRIGLLAYHRGSGRIALTHTEVDPSCQGRGFGGLLAGTALSDARRQGVSVLPICPFIEAYIRSHPEYRELVAPQHRRGGAAT